ncbi:MAG: hypothetical protein QNJ20_01890 [Paracoccaceae bacterium]|nr:hypothetical protein [Paracoccaceae bacterium]
MVLGEFDIVIVFRAIGVFGFAVYVGVYALLSWRLIGGDSLVYFAGNTVAAALVLTSNIGEFNMASVLIQIFFIAIGMTAMILRLMAESEPIESA